MACDDPQRPMRSGPGILVAASLLATVLGSVHAFSVFLSPLEAQFGQTRGMISLTYSLALVTLTLAVLWGYRLYPRWSAARFVLGVCLLGAAGALIAGFAGTLPEVWLGYSLFFGVANGLGYGFGLQIAAQANPGREGLAMGIVTAAYALGAVLSPALFATAVAAGGFRAAMLGLTGALVLAGPLCAGLMALSHASFRARESGSGGVRVAAGPLVLLWLGYGAGVATGLMVIGHAAGIVAAMGFDGPGWMAPVVVAICNLTGSLIAGRLADRMSPIRLLGGLSLVSALAVFGLAALHSAHVVMAALGVIGFAYGGTIAAYPAIIAKLYGVLDGPRVYGRVFTAWGTAGLLAPWLAGALFDLSGTYRTALVVAGVMAVLSVLSAGILFRERQTDRSVSG